MVANTEAGLIAFVVMIVLLFARMPIGVVMGVVGFVGFAWLSGLDAALGVLKTVPYSTAANYTMSVMPLFVLMGEMSFHSGISKDLYNAAHKWFGHLPGGLAIGTIWAGAGFGAMCGSSAAATATFGLVALPEMRKYKYNPAFAAATVAAAGTLAIMIPPSTIFIIYGMLTETSIGKLFIAGVLPGIVLSVMYSAAIYVVSRRDPRLAPPGPSYSLREKIASLSGGGPMVVLFLFVMGGIWTGVFTATEAGALGAVGALIFMIFRREFNRKNVVATLTSVMNITGLLFLILTGAYIFGYFLAITNIPLAMAAWLKALAVPPIMVLIGILILYFLSGWVMDELTIIVLTTPLFFPILMDMGFNPVWWGVMCCIAIQQGSLTPPVAMNLNIICSMTRGDIATADIFRRVLPYVWTLFLFMWVMIFFPNLALWLPSVMK